MTDMQGAGRRTWKCFIGGLMFHRPKETLADAAACPPPSTAIGASHLESSQPYMCHAPTPTCDQYILTLLCQGESSGHARSPVQAQAQGCRTWAGLPLPNARQPRSGTEPGVLPAGLAGCRHRASTRQGQMALWGCNGVHRNPGIC